MERVTRQGSPDFVPVAERIATVDNDGTLWSEQPMQFQFLYAVDRIKALPPEHADWKEEEDPFASLLNGGEKAALAGGEKAILELVMATVSGMTVDEFQAVVDDWLATAKHPTTGRPFTGMVLAPMRELLACLRNNGVKTHVVSGGAVEFIRVIAECGYGVPPNG